MVRNQARNVRISNKKAPLIPHPPTQARLSPLPPSLLFNQFLPFFLYPAKLLRIPPVDIENPLSLQEIWF